MRFVFLFYKLGACPIDVYKYHTLLVYITIVKF